REDRTRCKRTARMAGSAAADRRGPARPSPGPPSTRAGPDGSRRTRRAQGTLRPRGRPSASFLRLLLVARVLRRLALLGELFLVEVAERLRDRVHREDALVVLYCDVIERDDARKLRHVARE